MVRHGRIAVRLQYGLETPENPGASAERRQTLRDQEAMAVVLTADVTAVCSRTEPVCASCQPSAISLKPFVLADC